MFDFFRLNELSEKVEAGSCVFLFLSLEGRLHRSFSGDATGFKDSGLRVVCQVKNEASVKITKTGLDITSRDERRQLVRERLRLRERPLERQTSSGRKLCAHQRFWQKRYDEALKLYAKKAFACI